MGVMQTFRPRGLQNRRVRGTTGDARDFTHGRIWNPSYGEGDTRGWD
jgi:hypothetical protein